ncbi:MAG: hypothetical protein Q4D42_12740, partial [Eubacteriales bacterium]|nr:hypothetical protein [Eubacteriales bacterium]
MILVPAYDLVLLPGTRLYFKNEYYKELAQKDPEPGDSVIFVLLKQRKERSNISEEDIYPIGVTGMVEDIDAEDNICIQTVSRVTLNQVDMEHNAVTFTERVDIQ